MLFIIVIKTTVRGLSLTKMTLYLGVQVKLTLACIFHERNHGYQLGFSILNLIRNRKPEFILEPTESPFVKGLHFCLLDCIELSFEPRL